MFLWEEYETLVKQSDLESLGRSLFNTNQDFRKRISVKRVPKDDFTFGFTLWLFNSSPWYRWPIYTDGLPINSMVNIHGELLVITRW